MNAHETCCCRATLDTIDQLRANLARVTAERDRAMASDWTAGEVGYWLGVPQATDQDQLDLTNGDRQ